MPSDNGERYLVNDYTDLLRRPKLTYRLMIRFPQGLNLTGFVVAVVAAVVLALAGTVLLIFGWKLAFGLWLVAVIPAAWTIYRFYIAQTGSDRTAWEALYTLYDWRVQQPREFNGFATDTEPDEFEWQVILWRPTGRKWHDQLRSAEAVADGGTL